MNTRISDAPCASVAAITRHQEEWLAATRERVLAGEQFAICNADDFEEVFTAMGIMCLVLNQWNGIIASHGKGPQFDAVLRSRGYVPHRFARGFATSVEPCEAPWGGLPKPCVIVGASRDDSLLRITELWARAAGCPCFVLDFNWSEVICGDLPANWWETRRCGGAIPVSPGRAAHRRHQMQALVQQLERTTGRAFSAKALIEVLELVNAQARIWRKAMEVISTAPRLPVSMAAQVAAYEITWQRGRTGNVELARNFLAEVESLAASKTQCYDDERFRVYLATSGGDPAFHEYLREAYGGVIVTSRFSSIGGMYGYPIDTDDPLQSLAQRQLFMFDKDPHWEVAEARRWRADAMISVEPDRPWPSRYRRVAEQSGLPYLGVPSESDTPEVRDRIDRFASAHFPRL